MPHTDLRHDCTVDGSSSEAVQIGKDGQTHRFCGEYDSGQTTERTNNSASCEAHGASELASLNAPAQAYAVRDCTCIIPKNFRRLEGCMEQRPKAYHRRYGSQKRSAVFDHNHVPSWTFDSD